MDLITTLLVAVSLAMDAFAVSLGVGTSGKARAFRPFFRLSFHFGLFQAGMTFLGWLAGSSIVHWIEDFDHWVAFGLLVFVGGRMILSGLSQASESRDDDLSRGGLLVMVSVATSIDALAVGLGLAFVKVNIVETCLIIGVVTSSLSVLGLLAGGLLGEKFGKHMEILGGLILIGIGFRILVSHLLA
jgi:manganese efflux pump family protein